LIPDHPEIYLVEGLLHARSRDPKTAIEFYEKAIELNPSYAEAYRYLSEAASELGELERAWAALEMAQKLDPISVSTLAWVIRQATENDKPAMVEEAKRVLRQIAPETADDLQIHMFLNQDQIARAAIAIEDYRRDWPDADPHNSDLGKAYALLGKTDEAMALDLAYKALIASELGQRELALATMEEVAAARTDPHDRADILWMTYLNLGMKEEATKVLSDLWYGYAAEELGPRMDYLDIWVFVLLLRDSGRNDEADPIAELYIEKETGADMGGNTSMLMLEGKLEEALNLLIQRTENGEPPIRFTRISSFYFVLEELPGYATLTEKIQTWREEQRELYDELR
jgi:tetratricopeptide (TPR) repeat protein